jgi:molybdate transport system permease protein
MAAPTRTRTTHVSHRTRQRPRRREPAASMPRALLWLAVIAVVVFLVVPLAAIFIRAWPHGAFEKALRDPVVREALKLSLITTGISLAIIIFFGTPVAYVLARYSFRGHDALDTLIDLPIVLPPAVTGVALLMAFGRRGIFGPFLEDTFGVTLPFTTAAVVIAQVFVALPFFVRSAKAGFESVDRDIEEAARLDGSPLRVFGGVTFPLALPALVGGAVMAWARALGEFGATIMFAGNFQGRTQTMPLAIYQTLETGKLDAALALAGVLVVVSFAVLILVKRVATVALGGAYARE